MPVGQFSGSKAKYVYTTDTDDKYVLTIDTNLVMANSGLVAFDPASPGGATPPPKRFKPRGVYWQGTADGFQGKRKFLVAGTTSAALYASSVTQTVTVDSAAGKTTGRRGEKVTF